MLRLVVQRTMYVKVYDQYQTNILLPIFYNSFSPLLPSYYKYPFLSTHCCSRTHCTLYLKFPFAPQTHTKHMVPAHCLHATKPPPFTLTNTKPVGEHWQSPRLLQPAPPELLELRLLPHGDHVDGGLWRHNLHHHHGEGGTGGVPAGGTGEYGFASQDGGGCRDDVALPRCQSFVLPFLACLHMLRTHIVFSPSLNVFFCSFLLQYFLSCHRWSAGEQRRSPQLQQRA